MSTTRWDCTVCGYVHEGGAAPACCPVCGAAAEQFEGRVETVSPGAAAASPRQWRCLNCEYVDDGTGPPAVCPVCAAGPERFGPVVRPPQAACPQKTSGTIVIVGGGIAGLSAADAARATAPGARILLLAKEEELPYYRLNLTRYLAGEITPGGLAVHPQEWYADRAIDIRFGVEVVAVYPEQKSLTLKDKPPLAYDRLVLATGSHPVVPPLPGIDQRHIVTLRTRRDAEWILRHCTKGTRCVIVGGGVLGLEVAAALARHEARVSLLEGFSWLLPRQLNRAAGELLGSAARQQGIDVITGARIRRFEGDSQVRGVILESGQALPADLVVIAAGVRTNSCLARQAGLVVRDGVVVDNFLRTSDPDIFAAGDVAEHQGVAYGTWAPAQFQGTLAGMNAAGGAARFAGIPRSNFLKVLDVDLFSIGQVHPDDASYQGFESRKDGQYRLLVFRDGQLAGAILVGDTALAPKLKRLVEERSSCTELLARAADADALCRALAAAG